MAEEPIGDVHVSPIVEETVEVVHSLPQERLQLRTLDQVLVLPTVEIVDALEIVDSVVPQVVEEQLVAVGPTPATTDVHDNF